MMKLRVINIVNIAINTVLSVMAFFLLVRILFLFFSANSATPVVSWVLSISSFLMTPFANIAPVVGFNTGVLDVVALITLIVYLGIGYLLVSMVDGLIERDIVEEHVVAHHYSR